MKIPISIFLFLLCSGLGFADYYQAALKEANWEVTRTKTACFLRQGIDHYGVAEFVQSANEPLRFSVQEQRRKALIIKASLKAMPAPWMHDQTSSVDHPVYWDSSVDVADYGRLSAYGQEAEAMIDVLLQGQYPTFIYFREASSLTMEETRVAVSAIHFAERYREFADCRNNLRPISPNIQEVTVNKARKVLKPRKKHVPSKLNSSAPNISQGIIRPSHKRG